MKVKIIKKNNNKPSRPSGYYEQISPTAFMIAYMRSLTDIPYAKEIFRVLQDTDVYREGLFDIDLAKKVAPRYEARYKLMNKMINEQNNEQIVELGAGVSTRGIQYVMSNQIDKYTEVDLPEFSSLKKTLTRGLVEKFQLNLEGISFLSGNVLKHKFIFNSVTAGMSTTIINEGLMRYFDFTEKKILAKNILDYLKVNGGSWITTDITLSNFGALEMDKMSNQVSGISKIDTRRNTFKSVDEAVEFFNEIGFVIKKRSFLEVEDLLVSNSVCHLNLIETRSLLKNSTAFIMKAT